MKSRRSYKLVGIKILQDLICVFFIGCLLIHPNKSMPKLSDKEDV